MPFRATTVGRITGSAYGARQRSTRCMPTLRATSPAAYPRMSAGRVSVVARPTSAYAPTPRQSATASRTSSGARPGRTWCGVTVAISASPAARSASWLRSRTVRLVLQVRHAPACVGQVVRGDGRGQAVLEVPGQVDDLGAAGLDRLGQGDRADGLRDAAEDGDATVVDGDVVLVLGPPVAQPAGDGHSSQDDDDHQGEKHPAPDAAGGHDVVLGERGGRRGRGRGIAGPSGRGVLGGAGGGALAAPAGPVPVLGRGAHHVRRGLRGCAVRQVVHLDNITDHATSQRYAFLGPVTVAFVEDTELEVGRFLVRSATVTGPRNAYRWLVAWSVTLAASSSASGSAPQSTTWAWSPGDSSMVNSLGTTVRSRPTTAARSSTSRRSALASSTGLTSLRKALANAVETTRSTPFSNLSRTPMPPPPGSAAGGGPQTSSRLVVPLRCPSGQGVRGEMDADRRGTPRGPVPDRTCREASEPCTPGAGYRRA